MRQRLVITVAAVAALLPGGAAHAGPGHGAAPAADTRYGTVTLPTGDRVTLTPDGTVQVAAADGRDTVFWQTPAPDGSGDVVVVPADRAAELSAQAGRYNVSALLSAGYPDAAAAPRQVLDDAGFATAATETAPGQTVTVTVTDHSGRAPESSRLLWSDPTGADFGPVELDASGTGTVTLPAGEYDLQVNTARQPDGTSTGETVNGIVPFTVGKKPVEIVVDGTAARPVTVEVDRADAILGAQQINVTTNDLRSGAFPVGHFQSYVLDSASSTGEPVSFFYAPVLVSPDGVDPYTYNLVFGSTDGIPDDLSFRVGDTELARVATRFHSLGTGSVPGAVCEAGFRDDEPSGTGMCWQSPVSVPQQRDMYYTPGALTWLGSAAIENGDREFVEPVERRFDGPGDHRWEPFRGPMTAGFDEGLFRIAQGLGVSPQPLSGFTTHEFGDLGYSGTVVLSDGDTELGRYQGALVDFAGGFDLPAEASGHYTVEADLTADSPLSALATRSTVRWDFDCPAAPTGDTVYAYPVVGEVALAAEGVVDGYADRDVDQAITLAYRVQDGAEPASVTDMTMSVSYDDGRTWRSVSLDRTGNTATAVLSHPADATAVSVRLSATDDARSSVTETTVRSWLLS